VNVLHRCVVEARSYELDAFGHLNHAVYLNYLEHARFETLARRGVVAESIRARGEGVHVVRVEVDYRREVRQGDLLAIDTAVEAFRKSSMTFHQRAVAIEASGIDLPGGEADAGGAVHAEARVVAVWVGADGRPMRIPEEVREALGGG
jgi:YbgC/YbaW family acyl-CoA thioester hydrolase